MSLTLDPATEARLQQELESGPFRSASELIAHLLDFAQADNWLLRNQDAIRADLAECDAQEARGETLSREEAQAILADRRASRAA